MALIQATNLITKKELLTTDPNTEDKQLIYEITNGPRNGYVENKLKPGTAVTTFTQGTEDELYFVAFCLQLLQVVKVACVRGKNGGRSKDKGQNLIQNFPDFRGVLYCPVRRVLLFGNLKGASQSKK